MRSGQSVTLDLNVEEGSMSVTGKRRDLHLPDDVTLALVTAQQEQLSSHEGAIRFYPDGSSTGGQIRMQQGEFVAYIQVDWITGRVTANNQ